jgi:hypothetical protein
MFRPEMLMHQMVNGIFLKKLQDLHLVMSKNQQIRIADDISA